MCARADGLVRTALPIREVVAALVTGQRPVGDLVAAPAVLAQERDRVVVLRRRAILVLVRTRSIPPPAGARRRRQVIPELPGQALGVGVVERQRVERQMVGSEVERGVQ